MSRFKMKKDFLRKNYTCTVFIRDTDSFDLIKFVWMSNMFFSGGCLAIELILISKSIHEASNYFCLAYPNLGKCSRLTFLKTLFSKTFLRKFIIKKAKTYCVLQVANYTGWYKLFYKIFLLTVFIIWKNAKMFATKSVTVMHGLSMAIPITATWKST